MIDVSIIIVNYNGLDLLKKCLLSLYKFSEGFSFELIIVDNHSTEGNLNEVVSEFNDVIVIKNDVNLGFAKANNIGLNIANGKYVLFLNNDVYLTENSIKKVLDLAETQPLKTFIGCRLLNPDGSTQISTASYPSGLNLFASNFFLYRIFPSSPNFNKYYLQKKEITASTHVDYVIGAFLFGAREVLTNLNGFDERFFFYAEDIDLCFRLKLIGGKTLFFPYTSVVHIGGASVKTKHWFKFKNKAVSELQFFQKHKSGFEFYFGICSHFLGNIFRIPITLLIGIVKLEKDLLLRSFYHLRLLLVYPKNLFK